MHFSLDMLDSFSIGRWLKFSMEQEEIGVYGVKKKSRLRHSAITIILLVTFP